MAVCDRWAGSLAVEMPLNRKKKRMGTCGGLEVGGYGASGGYFFLRGKKKVERKRN